MVVKGNSVGLLHNWELPQIHGLVMGGLINTTGSIETAASYSTMATWTYLVIFGDDIQYIVQTEVKGYCIDPGGGGNRVGVK